MSLDVTTGSLGAKSPSWGLLVYQDLNNPTPASISDLIQLPWLPLLYSLKTQGHSYPKACCSLSLGISTQMSPPPLGFPRPPSGQEPLPPSLSSTSPCSSWHSPMTISPPLSAEHQEELQAGGHENKLCGPNGEAPCTTSRTRGVTDTVSVTGPTQENRSWGGRRAGDWHHTWLLPFQGNVANRPHFLFKGPNELHLVEPRAVGLGKQK